MTMNSIFKHMKQTLAITAVVFGFLLSGGQALAQNALVMGDDLCPDPSNAAKQTPDDLAGVQADIERFKLCLKRAELLKNLNDLALQNTDSLIGAGNLEDLAAQALDTLPPVAPSQLGVDEDGNSLDGSDSGDGNGDGSGGEKADNRTPWMINDIYGAGNNLMARITSLDDEIANVREGDLLSDGSKVISISSVGVVIDDTEERIPLMWAR